MKNVKIDNATAKEIAALKDWFSPMELAPGIFTRTGNIPYWTMALTKQVIENAQVAGAKCLDFGAVDGYMAALLCRQGAKQVVAVDAADYSDYISLVKRSYGIAFDYMPRVRSLTLVDRMLDYHKLGSYFQSNRTNDFGFDIVVCAGVLYHLYSPLHMIGALRTLVRPGGLVIIETAVIPDEKEYMSFNHLTGPHYIYAGSDTWFFTPGLLDYTLRMFSLRPIDILYRKQKGIDQTRTVGRALVVCRAESAPCALPGESQMKEAESNYEFDDLYRKELEPLKKTTSINYKPIYCSGENSGHVDLLKACKSQEALPIPQEEAMLRFLRSTEQ